MASAMTVISSSALTMLSCWTDFPVLLAISRPFMAFMWKSFIHLFIRLFTILLLIRSLFPMMDFASDSRSHFSVLLHVCYICTECKMCWLSIYCLCEDGTVQKRGVLSHASCTRLLPALLLQRSGPGRRGGSGVFSTGASGARFLLR